MERPRHHRSLVAWMLYGCVLFNLMACGIAHGQMSGLMLNGAGTAFCSMAEVAISPADDPGQAAVNGWASTFNCPMCSTLSLSLALFFCLAWLLRTRSVQSRPGHIRCKAPPRGSWPSANPRASPRY
ncbi:DUF2946 domain-containing protein [Pseudomonas protegens]|uniref:DUF2946 domain-containing protein n=1 Tax=Pseudomonas protegens TaxID=380021 RepID=UPI00293713AC|nr:DUF2946 domain-containing protein [Pseudomonas protegens]WOE82561.1 DUF2946 domain-containing protein [Pseudomonas protegens]